MDERKNYKPKFSQEEDPWDEDRWQTGCTQPPKDRCASMSMLMILFIFLFGIITVLGVINAKLFTQAKSQEKVANSICFTPENVTVPSSGDSAIALEEALPEAVEEFAADTDSSSVTIFIQESPQSVENIPQETGLSLQAIYEQNIPSVASISCQTRSGTSTGTGVVLSRDGYLVTNCHVIEGAQQITVQLTDDRKFTASVVGSDDISDLAVLWVNADDLTPAQFGDSNALRVGDTVTAIGDPLGVEFRGSFTDGIISAINRDVTMDGRKMSLIQTNAALNSGNSGGPLINCYGQVIGINTMKIGAFTDKAGVEGLGFAIPSATVKEVVDQLISQGYVSGRPTLGITGDGVSNFYQHYYRMPRGLYITKVASGSYAEYYGIEPGDILVSLDEERISGMESLNNFLYSHEVGDVVRAVIYRGGQQYAVDLTLTENKG